MEANPSPSQEFGFGFPLLLGHASIIHPTFISTDDSVFKLNAHQKLVTVLNFFCGPVPLNPGVRLEPARPGAAAGATAGERRSPRMPPGASSLSIPNLCSLFRIWGLETEKSLKNEFNAGKCYRWSSLNVCTSFPTMAGKDRLAGRSSDLSFQPPQLHPYPYPYLSQGQGYEPSNGSGVFSNPVVSAIKFVIASACSYCKIKFYGTVLMPSLI
jgi:hypothetical protein